MHTKSRFKKVLAQSERLGERPHRLLDHDSHGFDGHEADTGVRPGKPQTSAKDTRSIVRETNHRGATITKIKLTKRG